MAVGFSDLQKIAPEFSQEDSSRVNFFLKIARRGISETVWGDQYDDGVLFLTAHYLTVANRNGVGGSVTKEKVGDLEVSYSSQGDSEFDTTSWGRLYLSIKKTLVTGPRVVGCPE